MIPNSSKTWPTVEQLERLRWLAQTDIPASECADTITELSQGVLLLLEEQEELRIENAELTAALRLILDQVDYQAGNCVITEMVGAVLPIEVIVKARVVLAKVLASAPHSQM